MSNIKLQIHEIHGIPNIINTKKKKKKNIAISCHIRFKLKKTKEKEENIERNQQHGRKKHPTCRGTRIRTSGLSS